MRVWHWFLIMIIAGVLGWLAAMAIHSANAQEQMTQNLREKEWHIRTFISDAKRKPMTMVDYSGAVFKDAASCIAALTKPDAQLKQTHTKFEAAVHQQFGKDVHIGWTCAPILEPAGQEV